MFLSMKKRIMDLMDTVTEMLEMLCQLSQPDNALSDCLVAIEVIASQLKEQEKPPVKSLEQVEDVRTLLMTVIHDPAIMNRAFIGSLGNQVLSLKETFNTEVETKLKVVFFPYKASMWDSLATIYDAAVKDPNCVVHVVPIPYYQLSQDEVYPTYEGDQFPSDVPITEFNLYNLEEQQPDVVFVHNIYDEYNTMTRVYEQYFTYNLKKYTDMLVYVPYHISSFILPNPDKGEHFFEYGLPSLEYIDKIVLVSDFLKEAAIRDGIPPDKILALGSPKLDSMVKTMRNKVEYPLEWREKVKEKTVYLINTGCLFFAEHTFSRMEELSNFFNIPRFVENTVIIWRPHPLTEISILKYTPSLSEYYYNLTEKYIKGGDKRYSGIILDESADYMPSLQAADVLISTDGSLLRSYLLTEKKVLFWGDSLPMESLIPSDSFYYAFNQDKPWFELVKKFANGYDPLVENRKDLASKVYANADGTSGQKIYQSVKNCVTQ